jgi:hypothetical protein
MDFALAGGNPAGLVTGVVALISHGRD